MTKPLSALAVAVCLGLAGCGTPQPVKTLSQSQLQAFDTAIDTSTVHAEAILALAKKYRDVKLQALQTDIDKAKESSIEALQSESNRATALDAAYEAGSSRTTNFLEAKARLASDLSKIEAKTQELTTLLKAMKRAQQAIDTYLETEAVGEKLFDDIAQSPIVQTSLGDVSRLISSVDSTTSELKSIVQGFGNVGAQGQGSGNSQGTGS